MRDFDDDVLQETFSRKLSSFGWLVGWAVGGEEAEGATGHPCGDMREGAWGEQIACP